jgi:hypothetical protein
VTTSHVRPAQRRESDRSVSGLANDNHISVSPNRSIAVLLMNEALARARMREAVQANTRTGAVRPARLVAMAASKIRNRI